MKTRCICDDCGEELRRAYGQPWRHANLEGIARHWHIEWWSTQELRWIRAPGGVPADRSY